MGWAKELGAQVRVLDALALGRILNDDWVELAPWGYAARRQANAVERLQEGVALGHAFAAE